MGAGRLDQAHFSEFLSFFRGSSLVFSGGTNCREASEKHRLIAIEMLVDAAGRSIGFQIKNDAGNVLSYCDMTFEAKERVKDITDNLGVHVMANEGETSRVLGVSTNDANDLTRDILNRGYGYNDRSEVVGGAKHRPNGDAIPAASFGYDFDGIGNRKTHTVGDLAPVSYTPNSLNQYAHVIGNEQVYIVGRTAEGAAVSINGQPAAVEDDGFFSGLVDLNNDSGPSVTEVTIDADKAGKQTQETGALRSAPASATWQYDDDGNLLSDGLWDYTWNGENRLIIAETVATIPIAYRVKKEYVYDYRGRRVEETKWEFDETSNDYSLEQQLRWIYDDWNPVIEIANDQPTRHYVWGLDLSETPQGAGGVGGLLMSLDLTHASLSYSFVYDGNGNVLGLVNLANGELIGRYEYSPFGKLLWKEGLAAKINRWRFSTKLEDDATGWLYYGFRYYDPETGRWPSRDPIEERGGVNLYGFLGNRTISKVDYLGMKLRLFVPPHEHFGEQLSNRILELAAADLKSLCPRVDVWLETGVVRMPGKVPTHAEGKGYCCLWELVKNRHDNRIVFSTTVPGLTIPDNHDHASPFGKNGQVPGAGTGAQAVYNPWMGSLEDSAIIPPFIIRGHELCGHVVFMNRGTHPPSQPWDGEGTPQNEVQAMEAENRLRAEHGLPPRSDHYSEVPTIIRFVPYFMGQGTH